MRIAVFPPISLAYRRHGFCNHIQLPKLFICQAVFFGNLNEPSGGVN